MSARNATPATRRRSGGLVASMFSQLEAPDAADASETAVVAASMPEVTSESATSEPAEVSAAQVSASAAVRTSNRAEADDDVEEQNIKVTVILPPSIIALLDGERRRLAKRGMRLSRSALIRSYVLDKLAPEE